MASYDFEVDIEALVNAAQGSAEAISLFKDKDVEDLVPTEGALGSDTVWSAVEEFKDRWERGTRDMVRDIEEVSGRLGKIAMNYGEYEKNGSTKLSGIVGEVSGVSIVGGGGGA